MFRLNTHVRRRVWPDEISDAAPTKVPDYDCRSVFRTVSKSRRRRQRCTVRSRVSRSLLNPVPALLEMEPVALNNHPRTWPKDQRRDLQSRHRQLAATRSLSRPIITGTYSTKCSPLLKRTSGPAAAALRVHHRRLLGQRERGAQRSHPRPLHPVPSFLPSIFTRLSVALYLTVICPDDQR